jgi:hypothetical protein
VFQFHSERLRIAPKQPYTHAPLLRLQVGYGDRGTVGMNRHGLDMRIGPDPPKPGAIGTIVYLHDVLTRVHDDGRLECAEFDVFGADSETYAPHRCAAGHIHEFQNCAYRSHEHCAVSGQRDGGVAPMRIAHQRRSRYEFERSAHGAVAFNGRPAQ